MEGANMFYFNQSLAESTGVERFVADDKMQWPWKICFIA